MIKKTNKKNNTEKPVAKFDQSKEVVAKCEHPEGVAANCDRKTAIALSSGVFAVALCDRKLVVVAARPDGTLA